MHGDTKAPGALFPLAVTLVVAVAAVYSFHRRISSERTPGVLLSRLAGVVFVQQRRLDLAECYLLLKIRRCD